MVSIRSRGGPSTDRCVRVASIVAFVLSSLAPPAASAAPAGPDVVAVDRELRRGQEQFDRGEFIPAARTWVQTAALLPETPEHRKNRAGIYAYIADAYVKGIADTDGALLLEALNVLDAYTEGYASAYPGEKLPERIIQAQMTLRAKAAALQAAKDEADKAAAPPPPQPPKPAPQQEAPQKPWKGLVIGGGVALGGSVAMLAVFGAGLSGVNRYEALFNSMSNSCDPNALAGACAEYYDKATARDRAAVVGLVAAPVLLAAGATMLALGLRRKAQRHSVAPSLGMTSVGATWRLRF